MNFLKQNWFRGHPILSVILGIFALVIIISAFGEENDNTYTPATIKTPISTSTPKIAPRIEQQCHPSYSGCLNPNASDYDCAGGSGNGPYYTGTVRVIGPDVFGLDRDGDGWGCE